VLAERQPDHREWWLELGALQITGAFINLIFSGALGEDQADLAQARRKRGEELLTSAQTTLANLTPEDKARVPLIYPYLATLYALRGEREAALATFFEALPHLPDDGRLYTAYFLASLDRSLPEVVGEDLPEAPFLEENRRKLAEAIADGRADTPEARVLLAKFLLFKSDEGIVGVWDEVKPILEEAVAQAPEHWEANYLLGVGYLKAGETATALALLRRAVAAPRPARDPNYDQVINTVHYFLGVALLVSGNTEEALPEMQRMEGAGRG